MTVMTDSALKNQNCLTEWASCSPGERRKVSQRSMAAGPGFQLDNCFTDGYLLDMGLSTYSYCTPYQYAVLEYPNTECLGPASFTPKSSFLQRIGQCTSKGRFTSCTPGPCSLMKEVQLIDVVNVPVLQGTKLAELVAIVIGCCTLTLTVVKRFRKYFRCPLASACR